MERICRHHVPKSCECLLCEYDLLLGDLEMARRNVKRIQRELKDTWSKIKKGE